MSGSRLGVLLGFAALAAAAALVVLAGGAGKAGPGEAELRELERTMFAGAHLHPPPALRTPPGVATFCGECHAGVPHAGGGIGPAFANEHSLRMDCLVCHWTDSAGSRPPPVWRPWPRAAEKGQGGALRTFLSLFPQENPPREELARMRGVVTVSRRCFVRGLGCADCHRPAGIGAYLRPGTPEARVTGLERLEDYYRLPRGEKWYFPQLR